MFQAIGGGFAAGANGNAHLLNIGTDLIITGIVWQVATLIVFGSLVVDYIVRTRRVWGRVHPRAKMLATKTSFKFFAAGVAVAIWTIFCRCVYRIAEMALGWASPIMRDQVGFVIGEGLYVAQGPLIQDLTNISQHDCHSCAGSHAIPPRLLLPAAIRPTR